MSRSLLQLMPSSENATRASVPELDDILGHMFPVLDDGFVRLIDYMGSDAAVVQAARVSYGAGTKTLREDRALIAYLLRNSHAAPFEMCELKIHVRVPMDCWRQWIRHRGTSFNEYSTRYSVAIDSAQKTPANAWRPKVSANRQEPDALSPELGSSLSAREVAFHESAREVYAERLRAGVALEQARKDLPLSTYTEAYWKTNLHNLLQFLRLRLDAQAQFEIRQYAAVIGEEIISRWCPLTWEAFGNYQRDGMALSEQELSVINLVVQGEFDAARAKAVEYGLAVQKGGAVVPGREGREFTEKLGRLGLITTLFGDVR